MSRVENSAAERFFIGFLAGGETVLVNTVIDVVIDRLIDGIDLFERRASG